MATTATTIIRQFLAEQRTKLNNVQWWESYPSWAHGHNGWKRYDLGGTDIHTALAWYQHIFKPGCKEWRPKIIMAAIRTAAGLQE